MAKLQLFCGNSCPVMMLLFSDPVISRWLGSYESIVNIFALSMPCFILDVFTETTFCDKLVDNKHNLINTHLKHKCVLSRWFGLVARPLPANWKVCCLNPTRTNFLISDQRWLDFVSSDHDDFNSSRPKPSLKSHSLFTYLKVRNPLVRRPWKRRKLIVGQVVPDLRTNLWLSIARWAFNNNNNVKKTRSLFNKTRNITIPRGIVRRTGFYTLHWSYAPLL